MRARICISLSLGFSAMLLATSSLSTDRSAESKIRFDEIAERVGVRHVHRARSFEGEHGQVLEMFTAGGASVAIGDYNNDGWEDVFLTSSELGAPNRLFRNNGDLTFTDVTEEAGVAGGNDAGNIVSDSLWFDFNNNDWLDLLVVRFGTPLLYRNEGNGKFTDVSAESGFNRFGNSIAAVAFDYDNDGYLDLLFGDYFPPASLLELPTFQVLPNDLDNATNGGGVQLWRNLAGSGRFADVTEKAGLANQTGWILDVGHGDLNNNGLQDVYLAGDFGTDRIYFNRGNGVFDDATETSIGFDTKKGMNVDIADYNNDGWLDIYVTNITDEYMKECNMLWHNNGDETFTDLSRETGTCDGLWGWGAQFADFDNSGWQDLYTANGLRSAGEENYIPLVLEMIITPGIDFSDIRNWPDIGDRSWSGYQRSKLFQNMGMINIFKEIAAAAGADNDLDGRGVAIADFDHDGLPDIFQTSADQPALLYHNRTEGAGSWIALHMIGTRSNREGIGARVTVRSGDLTLIREVNGGNGYSAQSSKRLHFGLGNSEEASNEIEIRWPSGLLETIAVPVNKLSYIQEGKGVVDPPHER